MKKTIVVVGAQFGSEAKGHVAAQVVAKGLAEGRTHTLIRVAGPNAGHSAVGTDGVKYALRQIPVAAVVDKDAYLVLGAGSEIDLEVLLSEVALLDAAGFEVSKRLVVSDEATVLTAEHKALEAGMQGLIGSTAKGVGACRAERIMRRAPIVGSFSHFPLTVVKDTWLRQHYWDNDRTVLVEGTQGYGLGLHAGYYPFCTSSDCRATDFLTMAGIHPADGWFDVWLVARTFPIRVAGNSGYLHEEATWEELAEETGGYIKPEFTTVTKKQRRIGRWSPKLVRDAYVANGGGIVSGTWTVNTALTFVDYLDPQVAVSGRLTVKARDAIKVMRDSVGVEGFQFDMFTYSDKDALWVTDGGWA